MSLRNFAEPVTLVRSPTLTKGMSRVSVNGSRPESRICGSGEGIAPRRQVLYRLRDRVDVGWRRAAAAADDVDEVFVGELPKLTRHLLRRFVIEPERVGQPRIRVGADQRVGDGGDFGEMLAHRLGAERAIEADRNRPRMPDRMPERGRRLPGERAPGTVGDGAGNHDRQTHAALVKNVFAGEDRGLGVQRVKNGLDQNEIGAAVDEADDLLRIGVAEFVEGHRAVAGIVDVRRHRGRAVGRSERAGDEAGPAVDPFRLQGGAAGEPRAVAIELVDAVLHAVVGLRDTGRGKGVGFEYVGAGQRIFVVNVLDRLRLGEGQKVVVALLMAVAARKPFAAEFRLLKAKPLDLGAHGAVDDEDALRRFGEQQGGAVRRT